jgi:hypothetical protein
MAKEILFQLRSGAPGLPGPHLEELTVIGNPSSSSTQYQPLFIRGPNHHSIALKRLNRNSIWLDCALHSPLAPMPRVLGGYDPGDTVRHLIGNKLNNLPSLAWGIYCNILAGVSDAMIVDVASFGGIPLVIEFFCFWVTHFAARPTRALHIILLHDDLTPSTEDTFDFELRAAAMSYPTDPTVSHSFRNVRNKLSTGI